VPLAFSPFAIVEGPGLGRTSQAGKGGLVKGSFEEFVPTTHPVIVAGTFAGVVGCWDQSSIGGELIGALEGTEISNRDQKFSPEDHTHPWQASDDRRLLSGEKTLSQLLVESPNALFESEHFPGELGNDGGGDVLGGQADALGVGGVEGFLSETVGPLDATVSEVRGDPFMARTADLFRSLVVDEEGEGTTPVEVQCSLQSWKQRKKRLSEAGDAATFVDDEVASASEQEFEFSKIVFARSELTEVGAHTSLG